MFGNVSQRDMFKIVMHLEGADQSGKATFIYDCYRHIFARAGKFGM